MGSLSFAASACTAEPDRTIFSLVKAPADMVTGVPNWYASTCRECPAGCGIIAKNREGRVIKVEGNPLHPINRGKLCLRGQAAVQGLYHPDRLKTPMLKTNGRWKPLSYAEAHVLLQEKAAQAVARGRDNVRLLTELVGDSLMALFKRCLTELNAGDPLVFEPLAYESLKTANREVFGIDGLPTYRIDQADCLVSFGADFLETWLSPVEYARQFKAMHAAKGGTKGLFFHISAHQSLTGANADRWVSCDPGQEAVVAHGLINAALEQGRGFHLPQSLRQSLRDATDAYTGETTARMAGMDPADFEAVKSHLLKAQAPLVLGAGTGKGTFEADLAANLLNLVLDPNLKNIDFDHRHRVELAARRTQVQQFFNALDTDDVRLLLINNANPVYALPPESGIGKALDDDRLFVAAFSNFMDETAARADLVFPVSLPLESWDEFSGKTGGISLLQPAMGKWREAPAVGDVMIKIALTKDGSASDSKTGSKAGNKTDYKTQYKTWMMEQLHLKGIVREKRQWLQAVQGGGVFAEIPAETTIRPRLMENFAGLRKIVANIGEAKPAQPVFIAMPSIRFFDGRGANRPWLCEIPDPLTKVAWQTPVLGHPETAASVGAEHGDIVTIQTDHGRAEAIFYATEKVKPGLLIMAMGQGHTHFGRYAENVGINPFTLLSSNIDEATGGPLFSASITALAVNGKHMPLAHTDGSRIQHGRKIALSITLDELNHKPDDSHGHETSLTMEGFPFTLPLPEGYDPKRDFYPAHKHDTYRWAMVVDLDKCIGCSACAAACYAENNIAIVGKDRILEGREMSWLRVERYLDPDDSNKTTFFPMMCQHCDNAPCEPVCPVYAPHHSDEGLNNQIYNRCIGTRFCSQNCPYKVRRFNFFEYEWPAPMNLQLNPDVTVRSKGVMEKCSFCVQRIKVAHGVAKDEKREIKDGEVVPACVQTCPTDALTFGNLVDVNSRVRMLTQDTRAYQAMGYLNTKPAVIYLKKVTQKT